MLQGLYLRGLFKVGQRVSLFSFRTHVRRTGSPFVEDFVEVLIYGSVGSLLGLMLVQVSFKLIYSWFRLYFGLV